MAYRNKDHWQRYLPVPLSAAPRAAATAARLPPGPGPAKRPSDHDVMSGAEAASRGATRPLISLRPVSAACGWPAGGLAAQDRARRHRAHASKPSRASRTAPPHPGLKLPDRRTLARTRRCRAGKAQSQWSLKAHSTHTGFRDCGIRPVVSLGGRALAELHREVQRV